jgi:hypothetical protein
MEQQAEVRLIQRNELQKLFQLYKHLNKEDPEIVMDEALEKLWTEIHNDPNSYYNKVMLLTGSKKEETLRFYENSGFKRREKTGFIAKPKC